MKKLFLKFQGFKIVYGEITGTVCGYSDSHFICATEQHPPYSFRKKDGEELYILEDYKDSKFRYFYALEKTILDQNRKGKSTYNKIIAR